MKLGQYLNLRRSNCKLPIVKRHVVDPQRVKTGEGRYMPRQASLDTQTKQVFLNQKWAHTTPTLSADATLGNGRKNRESHLLLQSETGNERTSTRQTWQEEVREDPITATKTETTKTTTEMPKPTVEAAATAEGDQNQFEILSLSKAVSWKIGLPAIQVRPLILSRFFFAAKDQNS